ncbi:MAG: hypothetical protein WCT03_00635 [Candidatus Obscuribacterales bacterium]|jgi:hypothetical protein
MARTNDNDKRLADFNAVIAYWLKGKILVELNAGLYGSRIALRFQAQDEAAQSNSDIKLVIMEMWCVTDAIKSGTLSKLSKHLQKDLIHSQYLTESISRAPDILKLYLLLNVARVDTARIDANGKLTVELNDGIEISVEGHAVGGDTSPTDDNAWSLEIELDEQIPDHRNFQHCIYTSEFGEIGSDMPPAELLRIVEAEITEHKRHELEHRKGGPFPRHNTN